MGFQKSLYEYNLKPNDKKTTKKFRIRNDKVIIFYYFKFNYIYSRPVPEKTTKRVTGFIDLQR